MTILFNVSLRLSFQKQLIVSGRRDRRFIRRQLKCNYFNYKLDMAILLQGEREQADSPELLGSSIRPLSGSGLCVADHGNPSSRSVSW